MLLRLVINNRLAVIIGFFLEEKQEDKAEAAEDCAPVLWSSAQGPDETITIILPRPISILVPG